MVMLLLFLGDIYNKITIDIIQIIIKYFKKSYLTKSRMEAKLRMYKCIVLTNFEGIDE